MPCGCSQRRDIARHMIEAWKQGDHQEARAKMREMAESAGRDLSHLVYAGRRGYVPGRRVQRE